MRSHTLFVLGAAAVFASACSKTSESPAMADDLKSDLARVGGGDVQLAGSTAPKLQVVSASERIGAPAKAGTPARVAVKAPKSEVKAPDVTPPAVIQAEAPAPEQKQPSELESWPAPAGSPRPQPAQPQTRREPPGGWRSPGEVIRNAPFPIKP